MPVEEPTPVAEVTPEPPPVAAPRPTPPRPPARRPATAGAEPERPEPQPPAAATVAPAPVTPTRPAPSPADVSAERGVRDILARAARDLNRVDYGRLSADGRAQYEQSKRFTTQAEDALKDRNFPFATTLADKAAQLATELLGSR